MAAKANGNWTAYGNNRLVDNIEVLDGNWPDAARAIIDNASLRTAPVATP